MRALASTIIGKWDRYWFSEIPGYSFAAFRVFYGMYLICFFGGSIGHVELLFSHQGVYAPFFFDYAPAPFVAHLIFWSTMILLTLFILGWRTKIITPLIFISYSLSLLIKLGDHRLFI